MSDLTTIELLQAEIALEDLLITNGIKAVQQYQDACKLQQAAELARTLVTRQRNLYLKRAKLLDLNG